MTPVVVPMVAGIGPPEIILILLVLVLLFGAKKLPELARGSGRALRIFKSETKGLMDDDDETGPPASPPAPGPAQIEAVRQVPPVTQPVEPTEPVAEQVERPSSETDR